MPCQRRALSGKRKTLKKNNPMNLFMKNPDADAVSDAERSLSVEPTVTFSTAIGVMCSSPL